MNTSNTSENNLKQIDLITINKELSDIKKCITEIRQDMKILSELLKKNSNVCSKMSNHIDFIETTYDNLKRPLNFMKNQVERIIGSSDKKCIDNDTHDTNDNSGEFVLYDSTNDQPIILDKHVLSDMKNKFINTYGDCCNSQRFPPLI